MKSRRLKKQNIVSQREDDIDQENDIIEIVPECEAAQDIYNGTTPDMHRLKRKVKFKEENNRFLPDITCHGSKDNSDTSTTDSEVKKLEDDKKKFSLPYIEVTST